MSIPLSSILPCSRSSRRFSLGDVVASSSQSTSYSGKDEEMRKGWNEDSKNESKTEGKTLAALGFAKVGSKVARRAKGLGMQVIAHDPYAPADRARAIGVELVSFEDALAKADFFSLHMPLMPSTNKMLNDKTFAKMKKGVRIINVDHGGVIDEEALVRALDDGNVAQSHQERIAISYKMRELKVTPHLGASTMEAEVGVAIEIAEAVVGGLMGELAATAVSAPMVPAEMTKLIKPCPKSPRVRNLTRK
ncbi:hypothetical protein V2J09_006315 [Rumex salicifolius]